MEGNVTVVSAKPVKTNVFHNLQLNALADDILYLDDILRTEMRKAEKAMFSAFECMFNQGKLLSEHYELIINECGTQRAFAESIGKSESQISNAKRGYEALKAEGCTSIDQVMTLLESRSIRPTVRNYEKIGTLLSEPQEYTSHKEYESRSLKRVSEIQDEIEEIVRINERASDPIVQETVSMLQFVNDSYNYLQNQNVWTRPFSSERYLDFVRTFGRDVITREPLARCDPHHTDLLGGSGGMGMKLPDWMTIPLSRETHDAIESGKMNLTQLDIAKALIETMATYIVSLLDGKHKE